MVRTLILLTQVPLVRNGQIGLKSITLDAPDRVDIGIVKKERGPMNPLRAVIKIAFVTVKRPISIIMLLMTGASIPMFVVI